MIKELLAALRGQHTPLEGLNAVSLLNEASIKSTVLLLDDAPRKVGVVGVESLDSLVDYVHRHCSDNSSVFASSKTNSVAAVLDWHSAEYPELDSTKLATGIRNANRGGFARHAVNLPLNFTDKWKAWTGIDNRPLSQRQLAEFIEENLADVIAPESASLLETVMTIAGKKSVVYKNSTRLANGDNSLVWEETTEAKAGQKGDMKVPSELTLRLPVYAGCEAETTFAIRTMFRYNIEDGRLTFQLKMLGIEGIRDMAFNAVFESLGEKLAAKQVEVPVYRGAITKSPLEIYSK